MKQQIKFAILVLASATTLGILPVFASPPTPTPLCKITGAIKSVSFKDAYDEPCLKEPYGCPTDMELHHPARYYLDVAINSVSYISGETNFNTCENMYKVGNVKNIFINKDKVNTGDTFSVNQKIEGIVRSFWGSSFDSYTLTTETTKPVKQTISGQVIGGGDTTAKGLFDAPRKFVYQVKQDNGAIVKVTYTAYPPSPVGDRERKKIQLSFYSGTIKIGDYLKAYGSFDKTTQTLTVADEGDYIETSAGRTTTEQKNIIESSKIIENLLNENRAEQVNNISLQADGKTYNVTATKNGKLFFFIPVRLNIQITVDTVSGAVKETKGPWWSFLVRF